ncbi:WYL domain-containing transcriptional regulator [Sphingobium sp. WTD-1]|uniref:helix-turn-helix transcriptional regulator n=1 Tax=Sphingobium sp. WTD-1 TaxID=2979467 RepID=UPI0024DDFAF0|nr:WYL domain-containing transcriptional regulator [Sphingobium sp. WTD-1]WIA57851.1 WYL domain-containing transcriptional regulator [Sphingobium sp. WTD-1]
MGKLRRALTLVHLLSESAEGLTLDEIASALRINRRTAERLRDTLREEFDIEERLDDRSKRFFIRDRLGRAYTRPSAEEVAALEIEVSARRSQGASHFQHLERLLARVKSGLDDREKLRLAPDLEVLVQRQRSFVPAGPMHITRPEAIGAVQGAILAGSAVEFDYSSDGQSEPKWRRVVPYALLYGPTTYLVGKIVTSNRDPVLFRLDRMLDVRIANHPGIPDPGWNLDEWLSSSFGIWREGHSDIVLRVSAGATERARQWRFHPQQTFEFDGEELIVRFRAGGLREIADHIFTWGGEVRIEAPDELKVVMRERLAMAAATL